MILKKLNRIKGLVIVNIKAACFCYDKSMSKLANDCMLHNLTILDYKSIATRHQVI